MSRIELASLGAGIAQSPQGIIEPGTQGSILFHDGQDPVTVYATEDAGSGDTSGTFVTDSYGLIPGWVDIGNVVDITIPPGRTITAVTGNAVAGPMGPDGPQGLQGATGLTGPSGPIGPPGGNFKGVWSNGNTYDQGDWVFGSDDFPYNSVVDSNNNNDPTTDDGSNWETWVPAAALITGREPGASGNTGDTFVVHADGTLQRQAPTEISLKSFGAVGDGTTDDTAAVQAWMTAVVNGTNGLTGKAESGTYKITSAVGVYTAGGAGAGGGVGAFKLKGEPGCTFIWSGGASSGSGFFFHSAHGTVEGINFSFSSASYDGNLVDVDWGSNPSDCQMRFLQCGFGVRTMQNPRSMLRLNHTIISTVKECHFYGGTYSVLVGDGNYAIANSIRDCSFNNSATAHIYFNGGSNESNIIDGCTFEPLASGAPGAILVNASLNPIAMVVSNNWFGDTNLTGAQITTTAGTYFGNRFFGTGSAFKLLANNSVNIYLNAISCDTLFTNDSVAMVGTFADNGLVLANNDASNSGNAYFIGRNGDSTGYYPMSIPGVQEFRATAEGLSTNAMTSTHAFGLVGYNAHALLAGLANSNLGAVSFSSGGGVVVQPGANDPEFTVRDQTGTNMLSMIKGGGVQQLGFFGKSASGQTSGQQTAGGVTSGFTAGSGSTAKSDSTFTGNTGSAAYTIGDIVKALKAYGLLAT